MIFQEETFRSCALCPDCETTRLLSAFSKTRGKRIHADNVTFTDANDNNEALQCVVCQVLHGCHCTDLCSQWSPTHWCKLVYINDKLTEISVTHRTPSVLAVLMDTVP